MDRLFTPQNSTQAEANDVSHLVHLKAPGPFERAAIAPSDRAYLYCGPEMTPWCEQNLVEQGRFGRWIGRRLHKAPLPGYKLKRVFRQDVRGKDRFALQINVWSKEGGRNIYECDHDGWGALHVPSVFPHVGMGIWHFVTRSKTDQHDCMVALRARGILVLDVSTGELA